MKHIDLSNPIFINSQASLLDALTRMNDIKRKLLIVIDRKQFISVLSIGDIQRAILDKHPFTDNILKVLRKGITVCRVSDTPDFIKKQMLEKRTECMPILDEDDNLIELLYWEDIFGEKTKRNEVKLDLPVIIMAGGSGTRLKPLTNILPKPLLPIREKTIIEEIMDKFVDVGCKDFFISINYKSDFIRFYLGNLLHNKYNIKYFEEDKPLGTAGSMYLLKGKINTTFFVSNCDILIDQDIEELYKYHISSNNLITIVSALKSYKIPYGTIQTGKEGALLKLDEKPEQIVQINTGMYVLEPQVLNEIPENEFFHITDLIDKVQKKRLKVGVFPVTETSWQDIGNWNDYIKILKI